MVRFFRRRREESLHLRFLYSDSSTVAGDQAIFPSRLGVGFPDGDGAEVVSIPTTAARRSLRRISVSKSVQVKLCTTTTSMTAVTVC
ncbi:hypothetical protein M6B38_400055 [Iris pallida]|uniref:Uncharacterized protein n=1 Tax=Iris pallida TaxID=29817 RepID=A0AAX6FTP6_IRIPA|nr:hypothetical protein M6B38_400055 [Iris pallida]